MFLACPSNLTLEGPEPQKFEFGTTIQKLFVPTKTHSMCLAHLQELYHRKQVYHISLHHCINSLKPQTPSHNENFLHSGPLQTSPFSPNTHHSIFFLLSSLPLSLFEINANKLLFCLQVNFCLPEFWYIFCVFLVFNLVPFGAQWSALPFPAPLMPSLPNHLTVSWDTFVVCLWTHSTVLALNMLLLYFCWGKTTYLVQFFFNYFIFIFGCMACGNPVPHPGIKSTPPHIGSVES